MLQPEDGGVAEHVLLLATSLTARGFHVEVACSATNVIRPALAEAGIATHALPLVRAPGPRDLAAARRLRALDRDRGYDLVHAHSSKAGALARIALPSRRRIVYTPHCLAFAVPGARGERALYRAVEQALITRADAIVAVSEWERRQAVASLRGTRGRLRLILNGVSACPDVEPAPELLEFKGGRPLAGLIAVLRPQKDPLGAVRAAALLAAGGGSSGAVAIIGNGWLEAEVRREIERLGAEEAVAWFPYRPPAARYLRALDVLLVSSLWESLPLAPIEAMACGVPVVATRVGGVPEIVEDGVTGRLVEPGRAEQLAAVLGELLDDPDQRASMGAEGRRVAAERFGTERMVDAIASLYRELV